MATKTMSIHRALSELKTYEERFDNVKNRVPFVIANKASNTRYSTKTIEEYTNDAKAALSSAKALIENKKRIKEAIVKSNAETIVTIGGKEYTVAAAIERKNLIRLEEDLLSKMRNDLSYAQHIVNRENENLPSKLEEYLSRTLGPKDHRSIEEIKEHTELFESRNTYLLIDPCKISEEINKMTDEILAFKSEVDYVLSESNAITMITVDLVD